MSDYQAEVEHARQAALRAGEIILKYYDDQSFTVGSKGHNNPVTSADLEADAAIKSILMGEFPADGWLSEETADAPARLSRKRVWIVDPLDGTKEFIKRLPEFAVAIALAVEGVPVLGVTYNPLKQEMFWAAAGMGCYLGEQRVTVTATRALNHARVLASRSEVARGEWKQYEGVTIVSPTGSVAYKLALVAAGSGDASFSRTPKSEWDVASGHALLLEAGGTMTDIDGQELRYNQPVTTLRGLIASNGVLHQSLVELIKPGQPKS